MTNGNDQFSYRRDVAGPEAPKRNSYGRTLAARAVAFARLLNNEKFIIKRSSKKLKWREIEFQLNMIYLRVILED